MDNNRIKIAIGIITYKRPKGLEIAINSLLKQKSNDIFKENESIRSWGKTCLEYFK